MTCIAWTEPAVSDLDSIHAYIARDAQVYADAIIAEIFDSVDRLAHFPHSGRVVPEMDDDNTREVIVGNYRVIYDTSGEAVRILSVLQGARLFQEEEEMSDLQKYIKKRKAQDPEFAKSYDRGYEQFRIGVMLKQARLEAGVTQEELASRLHTKKTAISRIENHAEDIKLSTLENFAEAIGKRLTLKIA